MKLRKYQEKAVQIIPDWFIANIGKAKGYLLLDEVGLGKSPQGLKALDRTLSLHKKKTGEVFKYAMIICPAYLKLKWKKEVLKALPKEERCYDYTILIKSFNDVTKAGMRSYYKKFNFGFVIIDEVHYLINFDAQRTEALLGTPEVNTTPLSKKVKYLLGLSATFPPDRVGDLFPWLWATNKAVRNTYTYEKFLRKYAMWVNTKPTPNRSYKLSHGGVKDVETLLSLFKGGLLRRRKKDVAKDLPKLIKEVITVEGAASLVAEEHEILKEVFGYVPKNPEEYVDLFLQVSPKFDKMIKYKSKIGLLKAPTVLPYLEDLIKQGEKKFIVVCEHKTTVDIFVERLEKLVRTVKITGSLSQEKRFRAIEEIDAALEGVIVGTRASFSEGLDMVGFNRMVVAEFDWSPKTLTQLAGRIDRLTQLAKHLFLTLFVIETGIEAKVFNTQAGKKDTINKLFGETDED